MVSKATTADTLNRPTELKRADPDVVLDRYTYTYDGTPGFTQNWDLLDSLGNWAEFDDDGTSQTRTANEANEITGIDGSSDDVAHDAAGNMIRLPKLDGSGDHFHLVYDAWNRLVKVYDDNGTTLIAQYQYDGTGRRILKGVDDGTNGSLDTFTHFFHNRDNQVLETRQGDDVSGQAPAAETLEPKHQNIWSPRYVDSLILRDEFDAQGDIIAANRLYYLNDANYNVTALVDATGAVVERYLYTPYGTVTVLDPDFSVDADGKSDYDNTTLYTGREFDPETELMYYRARYYHSELGRFVARDPIGYVGEDVNLYRYCHGRPLFYADPTGLWVWPWDPGASWHPKDTIGAWMGSGRDCDQKNIDCNRACMKVKPPYPYGSYTGKCKKWAHVQYCQEKCQKAYMKCREETQTVFDSAFATAEDALAWVNRHKLAIGTVVVVAGITYVVATGGAGAVTLVPVLAVL